MQTHLLRKSNSMDQTYSVKYYLIGILEYILGGIVFLSNAEIVIKIIAGMCMIVATIYLIVKHNSETALNKAKLEKELLEIKKLKEE